MIKKTVDVPIHAEIGTIELKIKEIVEEQNKILKKITTLFAQRDKLLMKIASLSKSLSEEKRQLGKLKNMAWKSKNSNVIDLRNRLISLAEKKLQMSKTISKKEI